MDRRVVSASAAVCALVLAAAGCSQALKLAAIAPENVPQEVKDSYSALHVPDLIWRVCRVDGQTSVQIWFGNRKVNRTTTDQGWLEGHERSDNSVCVSVALAVGAGGNMKVNRGERTSGQGDTLSTTDQLASAA